LNGDAEKFTFVIIAFMQSQISVRSTASYAMNDPEVLWHSSRALSWCTLKPWKWEAARANVKSRSACGCLPCRHIANLVTHKMHATTTLCSVDRR
jgi:hypothetical protein